MPDPKLKPKPATTSKLTIRKKPADTGPAHTGKYSTLVDKQAQDSIFKAYGEKMRAKRTRVIDSLQNVKAEQTARIKAQAQKKK